jgi:hypothetical protein
MVSQNKINNRYYGSLTILIQIIMNPNIQKMFLGKYFRSKELFARLNLVQTIFSSKIQFGSNWSNNIKTGTNTKGFLVNINSTINPSVYKKIGTRNYWIINNLEIWNYLTVSLELKAESSYTSTNIILNRIYFGLNKRTITLSCSIHTG